MNLKSTTSPEPAIHRIGATALAFAVGGLVGPLAQTVRVRTGWWRTIGGWAATQAAWPTQFLGLLEYSIGGPRALAISIVTNVLLFAAVGLAAGIASRRPSSLLALFGMTLFASLTEVYWAAGFEVQSVRPEGVAAAGLLDGALFVIAWKIGKVKGPRPPECD
jgi:hypothetical protein